MRKEMVPLKPILWPLGKPRKGILPIIAVLATGDELVSIDGDLSEGKIRNINSFTIAAQVKD